MKTSQAILAGVLLIISLISVMLWGVNNINEGRIMRHSVFTVLVNNEMLKSKLEMGGDPNEISPAGDPVILAAVRQGCSPEILKILISHGASIDVKSKSGRTLLAEAVYAENLEGLKFLVEKALPPKEEIALLLMTAPPGTDPEIIAYLELNGERR